MKGVDSESTKNKLFMGIKYSKPPIESQKTPNRCHTAREKKLCIEPIEFKNTAHLETDEQLPCSIESP